MIQNESQEKMGNTFRWLPKQGSPRTRGEWISQRAVQLIAFLPVYTAIVATMVLYILLFGVPFVGDK
jgi:hypothetical protein